jgi:hypothetical protein
VRDAIAQRRDCPHGAGCFPVDQSRPRQRLERFAVRTGNG